MPQQYLTEHSTYVVDIDNFKITKPTSSCDRVNRAIARYNKHINSKVRFNVSAISLFHEPLSRFIGL